MEQNGIINCPQCGSKMALRSGKFGKFYGCTAYPNCKGTLPFGPFVKKEERKERKIIKTRWDGRLMTMAFYEGNMEIARWKYNKDGSIEKSGQSINGTVISTHPGGALKAEINFIDNEMSGNYEEFDINGNLKEKGIYRNGKKEIHFRAGEDNNNIIDVQSFDEKPQYGNDISEESSFLLNEDSGKSNDEEDDDLPF